jgi:hypothetical protein
VDLTGREATYRFGFQPESGAETPVFPGEPDWARAFLYRGLGLVDFGYDAEKKSLTLAFDTGGSFDQDAFYGEVFEVMRTLKQVAGASVEQVEITHLPSGQVAVCEMSQVEAWIGKLAPAEIVATYCQITEPSTSSATASQAEEMGVMHRPESPPVVGSFESKSAAFDMQLDQAGDGVSGPFFLLKYGELNAHATD